MFKKLYINRLNNRIINNANIINNIYADNITINNSSVSADVVAEESIAINSNSTSFSGIYKIDAGLNCGSFMRTDQGRDDIFNTREQSISIKSSSLIFFLTQVMVFLV